MNQLLLFIVLLLLQVYSLHGLPLDSTCFTSCNCLSRDTGLVDVICDSARQLPSFTLDKHVRKLDLSRYNLAKFPSVAAENFPNLEILNLDDNKIHEVDFFDLDQFKQLKRLSMERNGLSKIGKNFISNNPTLKSLSLSNNPLGDNFMKEGPIFYSLSLTKLELIKCELTSISSSSFKDLKSLEVLDLTNNRLKSLPLDLFQSLQHLKKVYLAGNPWRCGPELDALKTMLQEKNVLADGASLNCINGDGKKQGWSEVPPTALPAGIAPKVDVKDAVGVKNSRAMKRSKDVDVDSPRDQAPREEKLVSFTAKSPSQDNRQAISRAVIYTNVVLISLICFLSIGIVVFVIRRRRNSRSTENYYENISRASLLENRVLITSDENSGRLDAYKEPIYDIIQ